MGEAGKVEDGLGKEGKRGHNSSQTGAHYQVRLGGGKPDACGVGRFRFDVRWEGFESEREKGKTN